MAVLPEEVIKEWENHVGPIVFSTVDDNGIPNAIYATCVSLYDTETILIADNFFDKTRKNILNGSKGSVLFINADKKSFQIKGRIKYHKTGAIFNDMKKWNPAKLPGRAVAAIKVEEVFSGSKKL
ncbi:MAG: pyridoxamine 5'-phosphate oxidase family protein [bacterium]